MDRQNILWQNKHYSHWHKVHIRDYNSQGKFLKDMIKHKLNVDVSNPIIATSLIHNKSTYLLIGSNHSLLDKEDRYHPPENSTFLSRKEEHR